MRVRFDRICLYDFIIIKKDHPIQTNTNQGWPFLYKLFIVEIVSLVELVYTAARFDSLLLSGIKRMAFRANINFDCVTLLCSRRNKLRTASANALYFKFIGMYLLFHRELSFKTIAILLYKRAVIMSSKIKNIIYHLSKQKHKIRYFIIFLTIDKCFLNGGYLSGTSIAFDFFITPFMRENVSKLRLP